jgi:hypothetical protein
MTIALPQRTIVIGDPNDPNPPWQNILMRRVYEKDPFASEAGYSRLLVCLNCIERDLEAFDNLQAARKLMLPRLMAKKFLRLIRADLEKSNVSPADDYKPLAELQVLDTLAVMGWLHIVEQTLYMIKSTYSIRYNFKPSKFGSETWCKYSISKFNFDQLVPYVGEFTPEQEVLVEAGAVAAVERIDSLSTAML